MAGASLLALLDDIASVLDDVSVLTKVAAQKTVAVVGDDLALNVEQVAGVRADRELPVVWAVAKGSLVNKAILVPIALALSVFVPWLVMPLLMVGGAYLCFEGAEKLAHGWRHRKKAGDEHTRVKQAAERLAADPATHEKNKIRGAVRTDFILSAEIIVIALGTVQTASLGTRVSVVTVIALLMTAGVYGFVGGLVKLDDLGLLLLRRRKRNRFRRALGRFLLIATPRLMQFLSFAGTAAMFLVGGGILFHGAAHAFSERLEHLPVPLLGSLASLLTGFAAGLTVLGAFSAIRFIRRPGCKPPENAKNS